MTQKMHHYFDTPIQRLLGEYGSELYIKREDLIDLALGGNKARKGVYFLEEAKALGSDWILTYGSAQSNHCRVIAALAARYGIGCTLILAKSEEPAAEEGNFLLYNIYGADVLWTDVTRVPETIEEAVAQKRKQGYCPYFIQGGGHGNLGTQAYVDAFDEIDRQQKQMGLSFDYIFHASGTGTTQAGLVAGAVRAGADTRIVGISIARKRERGKAVVVESIREYAQEKGIEISNIESKVFFEDRYIGEGYGDAYPQVLTTIRDTARKEGILLDPTYTGKAFYGMLEYLKEHGIMNKKILFLHTGGLPVLFGSWRSFTKGEPEK